jgi:hypothetical protein
MSPFEPLVDIASALADFYFLIQLRHAGTFHMTAGSSDTAYQSPSARWRGYAGFSALMVT